MRQDNGECRNIQFLNISLFERIGQLFNRMRCHKSVIIGIRKKYQALLEYGARLQRTFATVWQDTGEYVDVRSSILFLNISLFEQKNIIFLVF